MPTIRICVKPNVNFIMSASIKVRCHNGLYS